MSSAAPRSQAGPIGSDGSSARRSARSTRSSKCWVSPSSTRSDSHAKPRSSSTSTRPPTRNASSFRSRVRSRTLTRVDFLTSCRSLGLFIDRWSRNLRVRPEHHEPRNHEPPNHESTNPTLPDAKPLTETVSRLRHRAPRSRPISRRIRGITWRPNERQPCARARRLRHRLGTHVESSSERPTSSAALRASLFVLVTGSAHNDLCDHVCQTRRRTSTPRKSFGEYSPRLAGNNPGRAPLGRAAAPQASRTFPMFDVVRDPR